MGAEMEWRSSLYDVNDGTGCIEFLGVAIWGSLMLLSSARGLVCMYPAAFGHPAPRASFCRYVFAYRPCKSYAQTVAEGMKKHQILIGLWSLGALPLGSRAALGVDFEDLWL